MLLKFINPIIYKIKSRQDRKMQIQSMSLSLSHSTTTQIQKIDSSVGTEATCQDLFRKKISLCSCSSSISLEENLEHTAEKDIFARYLFVRDLRRQEPLFEQMEQLYQEYHEDQNPHKLELFELGSLSNDRRVRVLVYFVSIWLKHMGYGTEKNKRYLMGRVRLFFGHASLRQFAKIYQDLNLLKMGDLQKLEFLIETCRNGWEYFVQEIRKNLPGLLLGECPEQRREKGQRHAPRN